MRADGRGGPRRGITRAARQNHLRAIIQSFHEGFRPHHGDNTAGTVQGFAGERWLITERVDAPRRQPALQFGARWFCADQRHAKMQPFFGGDVTHQLRGQIKMWITPCPAGGPNHQRNASANRGAQHQAQIALDRHGGAKRHARAQIMRARVNATAINTNDMRRARHAGLKACFRKAVAQNGTGREKAYFLHAVPYPLLARISCALGESCHEAGRAYSAALACYSSTISSRWMISSRPRQPRISSKASLRCPAISRAASAS